MNAKVEYINAWPIQYVVRNKETLCKTTCNTPQHCAHTTSVYI